MSYTLDLKLPNGSFDKTITATEEQSEIIDYMLKHPDDCVLINALAGAAKTSTLQFLAKYLTPIPTLSLAFNKRIAEAMAKVLPSNVRPSTVNSLGHRSVAALVGKRLTLETKKNYNLVKALIDEAPKGRRDEMYEIMGDVIKTISRAKLSGYIPSDITAGKSLIEASEFFGTLEEEPDDLFCLMVNQALARGIKQAYAGLIDFDDQIYISTLFGGSFPEFPRIMLDEVQDFSLLNHAMLNKIVRPGNQVVGVGDPWQSIYAFRGADTQSMPALKRRFGMHEMTLSVSFRCPIRVIENVHWRVPHMRWPIWAKDGIVQSLPEWNAKCIPDDSAIICRNNAPLLSAALALLRAGRGIHLVGTDLGPQLVRAMKKLSDNMQTPRSTVYALIDNWEAEKLRRARDSGTVADKANCLRVFAEFGDTLGAAIAYCEHLFQAHGPIQLLSGHKAKGLEWKTVYHLDSKRIPSPWAKEGEALEQEYNLKYVIETRPKEALYYVRLDQLAEET